MTNKLLRNRRGFTLIEMLVAVLLLTTAVAGPLTIASRGVTASVVAKDQVTAFFLAQDAVEYVRFLRDSNRLAGNSWLSGLDPACTGTNGCYLGSTGFDPPVPTVCSDSGCLASRLRYNETTKRYGHGALAGVDTIFWRRVRIIPVSGANEVELSVRVSWCYRPTQLQCPSDPTRTEIIVRENLFNWQ